MRRLFEVAVLSVLILLLSCGGRAGIQPVKNSFYQKALDATFALYGERKIPDHVTLRRFVCTATVVAKRANGYVLITAGHCVSDAPPNVTYLVSHEIGGALSPVIPITARLNGIEDVALFYLDTTEKLPVLDFGDESTEHIGDPVVNPNFTFGLTKQLDFGRVTSAEIGPNAVGCKICLNEFLIDATANAGASGSVVLSLNTHKIVGIDITSVPAGVGVEPISVIKKALTEPSMYDQIHVLAEEEDQ